MKDLFNIKDDVVVITGGTGILGREIGSYLASQHAHVVLLGRKEEVGSAIESEIRKEGGDAVFMKCDVLNQESVEAVCERVLALYGKVDALLNAAGGNMPGATISPAGTLFDIKVEEFQKVLNLNLTGHGQALHVGGQHQHGSLPSPNPCHGLCSRQGRR